MTIPSEILPCRYALMVYCRSDLSVLHSAFSFARVFFFNSVSVVKTICVVAINMHIHLKTISSIVKYIKNANEIIRCSVFCKGMRSVVMIRGEEINTFNLLTNYGNSKNNYRIKKEEYLISSVVRFFRTSGYQSPPTFLYSRQQIAFISTFSL